MLQIVKKRIADLEKCYALTMLKYQDREHFLVASEKKNNCLMFDLDGNFEMESHHGEGGVMTMIPVPGREGQFLTTQKFYSPNDSAGAYLALVTVNKQGDWKIRKILDLPFLHRFDILQCGSIYYLILCTLKTGHEYKDDWSFPGAVSVAVLPENIEEYGSDHQLKIKILKTGLFKNHGYTRYTEKDGTASSIISCEQGVFHFLPPEKPDEKWTITQLMDQPASDAVLMDIDNDGMNELCTIAPFHGDTISIWKKDSLGKYQEAYIYPEKQEFLHAIFGGRIAGEPVWVLGHRKGNRSLLAFTYEPCTGYSAQILDTDTGAANILHYVSKDKDYLIAANRESDEVAMYVLSKK